MKNFKLITLLLLFFYAFHSSAVVKPRYKAHLNLIYMTFLGDSVQKNGFKEFEIPFYEESEMTILSKGTDGDIGIKILGRPVWRDGKVSHAFDIIYYFRKSISDKWDLIIERNIEYWNAPANPVLFNKDNYSGGGNTIYGYFSYGFNVYVDLLESTYSIGKDSAFLPKLVIRIDNLKIQGKKVRLKHKKFEEKNKTKGYIVVGKLKGKDVKVEYEINMGSAQKNKIFEVIVYCTYYDKKTKTEIKNQFAQGYYDNTSLIPFAGTASRFDNRFKEELNIDYDVKVFLIQ